ncbi:MAG: hypothetical protein ACK4KT_00235 [Thermaurantimonas sp.]
MQKTSTPSIKNSDLSSKKPKKSTIDRLIAYSKSVVVVSSCKEKWLVNLN